MDWNIKNNFSDICDIIYLFAQFYQYRKCYVPLLLNVRTFLNFYFALRSKICSENVRKPINTK